MVEKRFGKLGFPDIERFENYLPTAFSSELTLLQKVNKIIQDLIASNKLTNEMVDYLNNFIETFDEKLYKTLDDILSKWLEDGVLTNLIRELINEEVVEARTDYLGRKYVNLKERLDNEKADVVEVTTQLEHKANEVDLVVERERIDNIVANNNPTEGNSELIDIRVGANGKTYSSAGESVREQFKNQNVELNKKTGFSKTIQNIIYPNDIVKGSIWNTRGEIGTNATYARYKEVVAEPGKCYIGNFDTNFSMLIKDNNVHILENIATEISLVKYNNIYNKGEVGFKYIKIPSGYSSLKLSFRTGLTNPIDEPMLFEVKDGEKIYIKDYVSFGEYYSIDLTKSKVDFDFLKNSPIYKVSENLVNENVSIGKLYNRGAVDTSKVVVNANYCIYKPFFVYANRKYFYENIQAYFSTILFEDGTIKSVSDIPAERESGTITFEKNGLALISVNKNAYNENVVSFRCGVLKNEKEYFIGDIKILEENIIKNHNQHHLVVKKDGTGDFTEITKAVKKANELITDKISVDIFIYGGTYDLLNELGGDAFLDSITSSSSNRSGLTLKNNINLIGIGTVILNLLIPDSKSTEYTTQNISALELYGNVVLDNIQINVQNCRYAIHDETGNSSLYNFTKHIFKNLKVKHLGNNVGSWKSTASYASGTSSGCQYEFINCNFISNNYCAWSIHNNENQERVLVTLDGCLFNGSYTFDTEPLSVKFGYYKKNSNKNDIFIKNCYSSHNIGVRKETSSVESDNVWDMHNFTNIKTIIL